MKVGICSEIENLELCIRSGADFIEVSNTAVSRMSESEFEAALEIVSKYPGSVYSCNCLIPSDIRLTGDDVSYDEITEFCEMSFERFSRLGGKVLVFGSAKAKNVPEGFSREKAMEQIIKCTRIFGGIAAKYGQTVVIEPLCYAEANIINLVGESKQLSDLSEMENVKAHVDFYHLMQNGETLTELKKYANHLGHVHIASPVLRTMPTFDDGADYKSFLDIIKEGNHDQTVSYEGKTVFEEEKLTTMFSFLKGLC